jgi:Phage integrase family
VFKRALGTAKLPSFRLYDLRHTFASLLLAEQAPITYVSAQLGHVNPATTLRYYARWIPNKGQRWVDLLDHVAGAVTSVMDAVQATLGTSFGTKQGGEGVSGAPPAREAPEKIGGPSRTRTVDPLIKSLRIPVFPCCP